MHKEPVCIFRDIDGQCMSVEMSYVCGPAQPMLWKHVISMDLPIVLLYWYMISTVKPSSHKSLWELSSPEIHSGGPDCYINVQINFRDSQLQIANCGITGNIVGCRNNNIHDDFKYSLKFSVFLNSFNSLRWYICATLNCIIIVGSVKVLWPVWHEAVVRTNANLLSIGLPGSYCSETSEYHQITKHFLSG